MLRRLFVPVTFALAVVGSSAFAGGAAAAPPACALLDEETGECLVQVEVPGTKPINNPGGGGSGGGAPGPVSCMEGGREVPCSHSTFGAWSNALQCYVSRSVPQPPATDPVWDGRTEGAIYDCVRLNPGETSIGDRTRLWSPGPPEARLSPEVAAQLIVAQMDLKAADIGIVPEDLPGRIGAVGAPVYMWTAPGPTTFGPQVLTANAGGVTITATAKVDRIVWSMGDGTSVTCRTPGTVYQDRFGFNPSPDCGHRYTRTSAGKAGDAYPVTGTSFWVVNWTGPGGSSGQIPLTLTASTSIQVGELQALVTR